MNYVTVEQLKRDLQRMASCAGVTLPARLLKPLLNLAARKNGENSATIARLNKAAESAEVELTGDEIRMVLNLALQAKLSQKSKAQKPRLKLVPPPATHSPHSGVKRP